MARPSSSIIRSLASSATRSSVSPVYLARRTLASSSGSGISGNTTGVDSRIFDGIPGFLPKGNVERLCEWQSGLWERVQAEVRNNPSLLEVKQKWDRSGLDITYLVTHAAREPELTVIFNWASLLLNNSYFMEALGADGPVEPPTSYYKALEDKVEAYAEGIVGGGWLWLVRAGDNYADVDIVPTFAAGTLLVTGRTQRGRQDIPLFGEPSSSGSPQTTQNNPLAETSDPDASAPDTDTPTPTPAPSSDQFRILGGARNLRNDLTARSNQVASGGPAPLACLNLNESAYIGEKYGVWGRKEYARDWFRTLNWKRIEERGNLIK